MLHAGSETESLENYSLLPVTRDFRAMSMNAL